MLQETSEDDRKRESRGRRTQSNRQGFRLTHKPVETEEIQREKEHEDVKVDY